MVLKDTIGLLLFWGFTGLTYMMSVAVSSRQDASGAAPQIIGYGFYVMAGFSLLYTVYYLYSAARAYIFYGDENGLKVIAAFKILSTIALFGGFYYIAFHTDALRCLLRCQ